MTLQSLTFQKLRATIQQLSLEQAQQLYAELGERIQQLEHPPMPLATRQTQEREVVEARHIHDQLYQLEYVRCGKAECRCAEAEGSLHGPYWYVYWREKGKLKSQYIGKQLRIRSTRSPERKN